jgi:uncharacterized protein (DUF1330 family)
MPQDEEAVISLSHGRHTAPICAGWDAISRLQYERVYEQPQFGRCPTATGEPVSAHASGVYIIAEIDIDDRERYAEYEAGFAPILVRHGGQIVGLDESAESLEGAPLAGRVVIAHFPTRQQALDWFNDPDYQAIAVHRRAASTARFVSMVSKFPAS